MSFGKVVDAVKRVKSLAVMKTILEKIYVDAIVGSSSSSSGNVDERFTEKKKEAAVAGKEDKKTDSKTEKKPKDVPGPGKLPESVLAFVENIRENPEELIDLMLNTLADYDFVSSSVTRLGALLDFGQLFKAFGNN